jgi:hypothetical protein
MKDMVTSLEKLRADAAEAALIQEDHRLLPFNPYGRGPKKASGKTIPLLFAPKRASSGSFSSRCKS